MVKVLCKKINFFPRAHELRLFVDNNIEEHKVGMKNLKILKVNHVNSFKNIIVQNSMYSYLIINSQVVPY